MSYQNDRMILRELAAKYEEIAVSEKHVRMRERFRLNNDLNVVRPPLIMEEIPWFEMNLDHELDLHCEDEKLREIEYFFRKELFREKHFACDNYIRPFFAIHKNYESTGIGFTNREKQLAVDEKNNIISHHYEDVLEDESALEQYHDPVITLHPEKDEENRTRAEELFGDILPVKLIGHMTYHAPWDQIPRLRGVDTILVDMYDRPEYLHKIIRLFTRGMECEIDALEKAGYYSGEQADIHCTPGDITYHEDGKIHTWFRTMAQMFSSISPEMHDEFDIQYSLPLARRFSYTYYGCCEPLHDRIDKLKQYENLRKVGVSPWADVEASAEQLRGDFVLSRKPNPANVALATDPAVVRKEIEASVRAAQKYGCPMDITLKDISTVNYKPENLILWSKTAAEVLDAYYGKD